MASRSFRSPATARSIGNSRSSASSSKSTASSMRCTVSLTKSTARSNAETMTSSAKLIAEPTTPPRRSGNEAVIVHQLSPLKDNKKNTIDYSTLFLQTKDELAQEALLYSKRKRPLLVESENVVHNKINSKTFLPPRYFGHLKSRNRGQMKEIL